MTNDEKIDKILETVSPIARMVEEHHTTLYGNGQRGLSKDVVLLQESQKNCPARKANSMEGKRLNIAILAVWIAVISCVTSVAAVATSLFKQ